MFGPKWVLTGFSTVHKDLANSQTYGVLHAIGLPRNCNITNLFELPGNVKLIRLKGDLTDVGKIRALGMLGPSPRD